MVLAGKISPQQFVSKSRLHVEVTRDVDSRPGYASYKILGSCSGERTDYEGARNPRHLNYFFIPIGFLSLLLSLFVKDNRLIAEEETDPVRGARIEMSKAPGVAENVSR